MNELTSPEYWDLKYAESGSSQDVDPSDFRQRPYRDLIDRIERLGLAGKKVLEIGAGGSAVLANLASRNPSAEFHGLDYSEAGCRRLEELALRRGVRVGTRRADLFSPPADLRATFDVVYSIGVAEHFEGLASVASAQAYFLSPGGFMLTVVPNLSGSIGGLVRRYAPDIMAMHKVYDADALLRGHAEAGLEPVSSGYLCSTNFGVLSSCFKSRKDKGWRIYLWLSRFSKAVWFLEDKLFPLPVTRRLSAYVYAVSRKPV